MTRMTHLLLLLFLLLLCLFVHPIVETSPIPCNLVCIKLHSSNCRHKIVGQQCSPILSDLLAHQTSC